MIGFWWLLFVALPSYQEWTTLPLWRTGIEHSVLHVQLNTVQTYPDMIFVHSLENGTCVVDTPIGMSYTSHEKGLFELHIFKAGSGSVCMTYEDHGVLRQLSTSDQIHLDPNSLASDLGGRLRPLNATFVECDHCWNISSHTFIDVVCANNGPNFCRDSPVESARRLIEDRLLLQVSGMSDTIVADATRCIAGLKSPVNVLTVEDIAESLRFSLGLATSQLTCDG